MLDLWRQIIVWLSLNFMHCLKWITKLCVCIIEHVNEMIEVSSLSLRKQLCFIVELYYPCGPSRLVCGLMSRCSMT